MRALKLKKLLSALVLVALCAAGTLAQAQPEGQAAEPVEPGGLPILVMHLPDWEKKVGEDYTYATSPAALQKAAGNQPALDAFDFDSGTEAVTAKYEGGRLVIVEFPTPQHSVEADAAIKRRVEELKAAGKPVPSLYSRVGNYSVFVFDAPDFAAAEKLASQVKYEKDVRWLGDNPHAEEIMTRAYTTKMGGVILTTLITTGHRDSALSRHRRRHRRRHLPAPALATGRAGGLHRRGRHGAAQHRRPEHPARHVEPARARSGLRSFFKQKSRRGNSPF